MSSFFQNFPLVTYKFGDESKPALFQNLTVYVDIFDRVVDQGSFYEDYYIQDGERPDTVSYKLYGTSDYHWLLYLANPKLLQIGWPLDNEEFYNRRESLFGAPGTVLAKTIAFNPFPRTLERTRMVYSINFNIETYLDNKDAFINYAKPGTIIGTGASYSYYESLLTEILKLDYNTGVITHKPLCGIHKVDVIDGGSGYDVAPTLTVQGLGTGAKLSCSVAGGAITVVGVINTGYGYETAWDGTGTKLDTATSIVDSSAGVTFPSDYKPNFKSPIPRPRITITRNSTTEGRDAVLRAYVAPAWVWMGGEEITLGATLFDLNKDSINPSDIDGNEISYDPSGVDQIDLRFTTKKGMTLAQDALFEYRDSNNKSINFNILNDTLEWYQDSANEDQLSLSPRFIGAYGYYVEPGTAITNVEALEEVNNNLRKIRVLKPNVAAQVAYEFNKVLKESNR